MSSAAAAADVFRPVKFFDGKTILPGADPTIKENIKEKYSSTKGQHHVSPHTHQAVYYSSSVFLSVDNNNSKEEWIIPIENTTFLNGMKLTDEDKKGKGGEWTKTIVIHENKLGRRGTRYRLTYSDIIVRCVNLYHLNKEKMDKENIPFHFKALFASIATASDGGEEVCTKFNSVMNPLFLCSVEHEKGHKIGRQYVLTNYQKNVSLLMYFQSWWYGIESHTPAFLFEGYLEYFLYCVWTHGKTPTGLPMTSPSMTNVCHSRESLKELEKEARTVAGALLYGETKTMEQIRQPAKRNAKMSTIMVSIERAALGAEQPSSLSIEPTRRPERLLASSVCSLEQLMTYLITSLQLVSAQRLRRYIQLNENGEELKVLIFDSLAASSLSAVAEHKWFVILVNEFGYHKGKWPWLILRYRRPLNFGKLKTALVIKKNILKWMQLTFEIKQRFEMSKWIRGIEQQRYSLVPLVIQCLFSNDLLLQSTGKKTIELWEKMKSDKVKKEKIKQKNTPPRSKFGASCKRYQLNSLLKGKTTMKTFVESLYELENSSTVPAYWTSPIDFEEDNLVGEKNTLSCLMKEETEFGVAGTLFNSIVVWNVNESKKGEEHFGNSEVLRWWHSRFEEKEFIGEFFDPPCIFHFRKEKEDEMNQTQKEEMEQMLEEPLYTTPMDTEVQYEPPSLTSPQKLAPIFMKHKSKKEKAPPMPSISSSIVLKQISNSSIVSIEDFTE